MDTEALIWESIVIKTAANLCGKDTGKVSASTLRYISQREVENRRLMVLFGILKDTPSPFKELE